MSLRTVCLMLILTLPVIKGFSFDNIAFYHYGQENGLNEPRIKCFTQDSVGFIWMAGDYTLTRFDGHEFKTYVSSENTSMPWGRIQTLYTGVDGKLWIGSGKGFSTYNFTRNEFSPPLPEWENIGVNDFACERNNQLLIATNQGLALFDQHKQTTQWITGSMSGNSTIPADTRSVSCSPNGEILFSVFPSGLYRIPAGTKRAEKIERLQTLEIENVEINQIESTDENIYINTTLSGFYIYNKKTNSIKKYDPENLEYNAHQFQAAGDSLLWIATDNGIIRINHLNDHYRRFTNVPTDPLSLERTAVSAVFADRQGNLWVSSGIRGIDYGLITPFGHMELMDKTPYSLSQKEVTCMHSDNEGKLWIGYESGLIEKNDYDPLQKTGYYLYSPTTGRSSGTIFTIYQDSRNRVWAGGWRSGLFMLDSETDTFRQVILQNDNLNSKTSRADIRTIREDSNGNLWIAAHGTGLIRYNPDSGQSKLYQQNPQNLESGISNNYIFDLCFDRQENLWISTAYGITRMDISNETFSQFIRNPDDSISLPSNMVYTVHCDAAGSIWAGTNSGLAVYLPQVQKFRSVKTNNNYLFQNIAAIESATPGEIWASTKSGIIRIKYSLNELAESGNVNFDCFNSSNGLISSVYYNWSSVNIDNSTIYFAGNEGVDFFNPHEVLFNKSSRAKTVITGISVYGEPIYPHLINREKNVPHLQLNYDQRMISFRFTSIDYSGEGLRQFRYRLEGFDDQWVYPQDEKVATYTNLRHGNYLFTVQTLNKNGNWLPAGDTLRIAVKPPFWKTIPFIVLTVMVMIVLLVLIFRIHSRRIRRKAHELELLVQKRTSELTVKNAELEAANQTKSKLFSIISHDLRSPFTGLLGLLELLNDSDDLPAGKQKEFLQAAWNSAKNTFNLLENLLLWARSQTNEIKYQPEQMDISRIIIKNIELSREQAQQKNIAVQHNVPENLQAHADSNMIDTVFRNILNNAIKFTRTGGKVEISATEHNSEILIKIVDTGIGLNGTRLDDIFSTAGKSRPGTTGETGTGLGLVISKEFILKNKGKIWAVPNQPKGTIFHFTVPKNN